MADDGGEQGWGWVVKREWEGRTGLGVVHLKWRSGMTMTPWSSMSNRVGMLTLDSNVAAVDGPREN